MENITVELTTQEFMELLQAHKKLTEFLEKVIPTNELYLQEFLNGLQIAEDEVRTFNDLIII